MKFHLRTPLKKKNDMDNTVEQIQKRERLVSGIIIMIAIIIGVLITFLFTGLIDLLIKQ